MIMSLPNIDHGYELINDLPPTHKYPQGHFIDFRYGKTNYVTRSQ